MQDRISMFAKEGSLIALVGLGYFAIDRYFPKLQKSYPELNDTDYVKHSEFAPHIIPFSELCEKEEWMSMVMDLDALIHLSTIKDKSSTGFIMNRKYTEIKNKASSILQNAKRSRQDTTMDKAVDVETDQFPILLRMCEDIIYNKMLD